LTRKLKAKKTTERMQASMGIRAQPTGNQQKKNDPTLQPKNHLIKHSQCSRQSGQGVKTRTDARGPFKKKTRLNSYVKGKVLETPK